MLPWQPFFDIKETFEALYHVPLFFRKQNEPSLTANFTTPNITAMKKYLVGDRLFVDWMVSHTYNTSYESAKNVRITFYSNTLKILQGTYNTPNNSGNNLTVNNERFRSGEINVATLAQGRWKISEVAKYFVI